MERDIELIEKYLAGTLSESERIETEQRLQSDSEFAERVTLMQRMEQAINTEVDDFRNDLKEEFEAYQSRQPVARNPSPFFRRPYLIAASVLAVIGMLGVYLVLQQTTSPTDLYAANFTVPPENITVRDQQTDQSLNMALTSYNAQNYSQALLHFNKVLQQDPKHHGVLFYSGICYLLLENPQDAQNAFTQIPFDSNPYYAAAQWYLGLSYLKTGDKKKSKTVFSALHESHEGKYGRDAGVMLKQLE